MTLGKLPRSLARATFEVIPGTDIDEIKAAHPEWSEDQCQDEQTRVVLAAFKEKPNAKRSG